MVVSLNALVLLLYLEKIVAKHQLVVKTSHFCMSVKYWLVKYSPLTV